MEHKPSDFFVGVVDLFGVLMPGAIAARLLSQPIQVEAARLGISGIGSGAAGWVAFFVGSYVLGHLIFLVGASLDPAYDAVRGRLIPLEKDALYQSATAARRRLLRDNPNALNTFKFAKAVLQLHSEAATAAIARLEADSKFFRSLSVLLAALLVTHLHRVGWTLGIILLGLLLLCLWRYGERRFKSTELAFSYLLAHYIDPKPVTSPMTGKPMKPQPQADLAAR